MRSKFWKILRLGQISRFSSTEILRLDRISRFFSTEILRPDRISRFFSTESGPVAIRNRPELNFDYLLDPKKKIEIQTNIENRKKVGSIDRVHELWQKIEAILRIPNSGTPESATAESLEKLWNDFYAEAEMIPNRSHPGSPTGDESKFLLIETIGAKPGFESLKFGPKTAEEMLTKGKLLRTDFSHSAGDRAYALISALARLEFALVSFARDRLQFDHGFKFLSVPDLIPPSIPKACGLMQRTDKEIFYHVGEKFSLSGTGEMGIASLLAGKTFDIQELPLKLATVSRCFRPEIARGKHEGRLYRVHEFTKVEMFVVTADENKQESEEMFENLLAIQRKLYGENGLRLHFRVLEMPTEELGAAAYRKVDMEAWMPGRDCFGEISSTSNCIDFQSRRLGLKYRDSKGNLKFCHTLNGTAVAVPRLVIAILEQKQQKKNVALIPNVLTKYFDAPVISAPKNPLSTGLVKQKSIFSIDKRQANPTDADE